MALVTLSTVSANKEKKCLVKSGKDTPWAQLEISMYSSLAKAVYLLRERKYICFGQYTISSLKNERDSRILPLHTAIMGEFRAEDFRPYMYPQGTCNYISKE